MSIKVEPIAMTQTQFAKAIGVTDRTLRNWTKRGIIVGHRAANGVKLYRVEQIKKLAGVKRG